MSITAIGYRSYANFEKQFRTQAEHQISAIAQLFTAKTKGVGLGLAVSQKLAEANGGRIEAHSEIGKGSTFSVYFPIYKEQA